MSGYPPPYPAPTSRYSPPRTHADRSVYTPAQPAPDYPSYPPYTAGAPPPASAYRPYDAYSSEPPRPPYPYEQPRDQYSTDSYDPYQPSNAYTPGLALRPPPQSTFVPPPRSEQQQAPAPAPLAASRPPLRAASPPRRPVPRRDTRSDAPDLPLLTPPTTVDLSGYTAAVHTLPPSHLPITKLVCVHSADAMDLHRHLCQRSESVWYTDGSSRAGEGWSAAVQWIMDPGRSGSKMRGCVGPVDALETELGGICKAVEGFQELLQHSIKDATPVSHELVVFCDSAAAIVSIDTSSRPESIRFEKLWRGICAEYRHAHLTLVWIPKNSGVEGHTLANKIATVGASNSYLKKKKEGSLPEIYRRPGGGEPAPSGSSEAGPWQRGDADPSRQKSPFERPKPVPLSPAPRTATLPGRDTDVVSEAVAEEEPMQPREGSIFVTRFPDEASAKDLGVLFAQFGEIVAVDIYHVTAAHPRFAFVAYTSKDAGDKAIADLHAKPINLDSPFARDNIGDLGIWEQWQGQLTVVRAEPPRLVPSAVAHLFPDLPDWALGFTKDAGEEEQSVPQDTSSDSRKRERSESANVPADPSSPFSGPNSPSPRKRARQLEAEKPQPAHLSPDFASRLSRLIAVQTEPPDTCATPDPAQAQNGSSLNVVPHATPPPFLPPFPPTLKAEAAPQTLTPSNGTHPLGLTHILPPTPNTAERPPNASARLKSPSSDHAASSKPALTNSAAEPQEYPIKVGAKTIRSQLNLVRNVFVKHDVSNWIAHSCLIAVDLDQARRALQADLYATDEAFLTGRDLERTLLSRGYTAARVDVFIKKVLNVLDGIALAEQGDAGLAETPSDKEESQSLKAELAAALAPYPDQSKEAIGSAGKLLEYLIRGKEAQEKKRLDVERRVKVLEGMVKIGEAVSKVVSFLLQESAV